MDIFEEIKEAVMNATPGEDTRNYYRNQGMAIERERIIKLLDDWKCGHPNCDGDRTEVCYPKHYLIERIMGETK